MYFLLKQKPLITEKPDAVDYQFMGGEIELKNIAFKHILYQLQEKEKELKLKDVNEELLASIEPIKDK